jgi:nucleoside-diphosphate-sugar epimerase
MTKPVAVTGASGFVGQVVIAQLLASGHRVRALIHRRPLALSHPELEVVTGGLDDEAALQRLMAGCTAVVHVAGLVRGRSSADFSPVNVEGAARVARMALALPRPPRLILISSLAAREPGLSAYAASKRKGEEAFVALCEGNALSWAVLRPPAIYGPGDRELLPLFTLMARGITVLPGLPGARLSLLHVGDLGQAVIALLKGDARGIFELHDGHEHGYALEEVAATIARITERGRGVRIRLPGAILRAVAAANLAASRVFGYQPMLTPGKVNELRHPDWVCDNTELTRATGWKPVHSLEDGLRALLETARPRADEGLSNVI